MTDRELRSAFITGATGAIGSALAARLSGLGWEVTALARSTSDASHLEGLPGVQILRGDMGDSAVLEAGAGSSEVVFHLAALVHAAAGTPAREFTRVNVEGTQTLIDAASRAGANRFVFFSTVAVYRASEKVMSEESPPGPESPYGMSKLQAERLIAAHPSAMSWTILRLPVVYGPRDRGNVMHLIRAIDKRRFGIIGDGRNLKTMLAMDNAVDASLLVATDDRASSRTYIVADDRDYTQLEVAASIARMLGRSTRFIRLPLGAMATAGRVADEMSRLTGVKLPLTADRVKKLAMTARYSSDRIQRELGYIPRRKLWVGLAQEVEAMRRDGLIR